MDPIVVGVVPPGSKLEYDGPTRVIAFLPDGSAKLFEMVFVDGYPVPVIHHCAKLVIEPKQT